MTRPLAPMWKRLLLWIASIGLLQLALLALYLLGGSFSYMGGRDAETMKTALALYGSELRPFLQQLWLSDTLVLGVWTLPLGVAFVLAPRPLKLRAGGLLAGALFLAYWLWMGLGALRVPTLLSANLYGDGQGLSAVAMRAVCSAWGPLLLGLGFVAVAASISRATSLRLGVFALCFYAVFIWGLARKERYHPRLSMRPGSVIILMADSLRSDRITPEHLPELYPLIERSKATIIPSVVPPLARTTPAIVSLLTGRLPVETGVTTMFSNKETFKQVPSVVSAYRDAGFCTVAVGEYPAEMLSKYDFGFEIVEVPQARFKEISLQAVMSNDPFFLTTASWRALRPRLDTQLQRLFEGLPTFASPMQLMSKFEAQLRRCGERPIFALVFADQPHYPYVQTWPYYLAKGADYSGRFKFGKDDPNITPSTPEDKARIRELYDMSLLSSEHAFSRMLAYMSFTGQLEHATVILTGDHGESLYDHLDIIGHGDQVGELEGITVPWVVFGPGRAAFATPQPMVQSTRLAPLLAKLNGISYQAPQALPEDVIYVETDMWMANTPNLPKHRIRYPELSGVLTLEDKEAHIEIDRAFLPTIDFAKHRLWIVQGKRYLLEPGEGEIRFTIDGQPARPGEVPEVIRGFMNRYYPDAAPALLP
jgi:hypothetical protein